MRFLSVRFALWLGVFAVLPLALLWAGHSAAQVLRTVKAELVPETQELAIGPEIYITRDTARNLNYNTVITRHMNNQRGERQGTPVIDLGLTGTPAWLVFTVENKTAHDNWILDFGAPGDGRYAQASRVLVRNHSKGQTLVRALQEEDHPREGLLHGAAVMATIPAGETSLFVAYIEPAPGFAGTISPRILRYENALSGASSMRPLGVAALILFVAASGFYAALALSRKNMGTLLFSAYYVLNAGLFAFYSLMFQSDIALNAAVPAVIMGLVMLCALGMTKNFLDLGEEQDREKLGLLISAILIVAAAGLQVSGFFAEDGYSQMAFLAAVILALGLIVIAGFMQVGRASYGAPHYAVGWLFTLGGVVFFALGAAGVMEPGALVMNAYWLSLIPQGLFFMAGMLKKIQTEEDQEQQAQIRQLREAQTISKLKQTKESADQSRLLRVIEREREVMAEMREKEMRRTEEMRLAMEHADEANRAKSAFLAVVSHEIRTPMTGIMGMVKLLLGTKLGSEQNDYVLAVQKSGDTMMALLNDILDFEKIESGNMELEHIDFDLHKLVSGVVTLMSGQATEKKIYLKSDIPEDIPKYVRGDPTRLRQVILNLVGNAIKFTESGGVTIHLRSTPLNEKIGKIKADYEIYFAVEDTGIGIPLEVQENLFSPFSQAEKSTTRKYGGTGLGLAICKKLIEAMGSSIRVSSEEGAGSTFYFTLLMEEGRAELAEDLADQKLTSADYETDPRHILVVEDNEMNRRVFTGLLEKQGHRVVTSPSGEDALVKHEAMNFDLIISDVNMNGMSGMDLTRAIRALPNTAKASIPVIALTGNVRQEDIKEFYEANMNGFLAKPIDPDKLALMIKKFSEGQLDTPVILPDGRTVSPEEHKEQIETNIFPPAPAPAELEIDSFGEPAQAVATAPIPEEAPPPLEPMLGAADEPAPLPPLLVEDEEQAAPANAAGPADDNDRIARYKAMFDFELLEQLAASLGKAQFEGLINDYIEHADRIVAALSDARDMKDLKEMKMRAHELKGMAANFGVQSVSKIAAQAESFAAKSQGQEAVDVLKDIVSLNHDTNIALREWMEGKL